MHEDVKYRIAIGDYNRKVEFFKQSYHQTGWDLNFGVASNTVFVYAEIDVEADEDFVVSEIIGYVEFFVRDKILILDRIDVRRGYRSNRLLLSLLKRTLKEIKRFKFNSIEAEIATDAGEKVALLISRYFKVPIYYTN